jgi:hypothetical protein
MDSQHSALATQLARDMCDHVSGRAGDVGFSDGIITAVRHQGRVKRVYLDLFDTVDDDHQQAPVMAPAACVGLGETKQILRDTVKEGLAFCIVPFGNVAMLFSKGVLRQVSVTEKFRIPAEIPQLGRLFLPPSWHPLDGQPSLGAPVSASGEHG